MKRRIIFLVVAVAVLTAASFATFGESLSKTVELYFRNIKIMIDGEEYIPTDADGDRVEPFIYNGTTYVPLRAVAEAFDKDVAWDDATSTITITPKNEENGKVNGGTTPVAKPVLEAKEGSLSKELSDKLVAVQPMGERDGEILMNIEGVPVSADMVRYATIMCNEYHADSTAENKEEIIEKEIYDYHVLNASVVNHAELLGISITDEEFETEIASQIAAMKQIYGDQYEQVFESYVMQSPYTYFLTQSYNILFRKIYDSYLADNAFKTVAKTKTLSYMKENDYVRAKHILISFPETEGMTEREIERAKDETWKKAMSVISLAANGEDFDALIEKYGEDPGMVQNPDGYYFTKGQMVLPFEETAYALNDGEVSGLVETVYGYHIIMKLPLDDEAITSTPEFANISYEALKELLTDYSEDYEITYSDNYAEREKAYYEEFTAMLASANAAK